MSQIYGCWLDEGFDSSPVVEKLKNPHADYFPLFSRRVDAIVGIAEVFIDEIKTLFPLVGAHLRLSYSAAISAIGRYVNDIMHYKMWHDVRISNKSKMIAHTIKWLALYPVVWCEIDSAKYADLDAPDRAVILDINTMFISSVIRYFLSFFCEGSIPSVRSFSKVFYLVDTAQYDAKTAAITFDGLIL